MREINKVEGKEVERIEPNSAVRGDCLEEMQKIDEGSVSLILTDLPYGRTKNKWDKILPYDEMWEQYKRVLKENGVVVLFAEGMFMAELMVSNKKMWRYNIVWDKILTTGFLNANRQPLRRHEEMLVFYRKQPTYNPQKKKGKPNHSKGKLQKEYKNRNYGEMGQIDNRDVLGDMKHPTSIWQFQKPHPSKIQHPTEKPVDCLEEVIRTYTNEGELVLDSCAGSFSTAVASENTGRRWICIEKEKEYYDIGVARILQNREKQDNIHITNKRREG